MCLGQWNSPAKIAFWLSHLGGCAIDMLSFWQWEWLIISNWKRFRNGPQCIMSLTVNLTIFFLDTFLQRFAKLRDNIKTHALRQVRWIRTVLSIWRVKDVRVTVVSTIFRNILSKTFCVVKLYSKVINDLSCLF